MNGEILKELKELEKDDLIQDTRVTNRLLLAGLIQLFDKVDENNKLKPRLSRIEGVVALLTTLWIAALGWTIFGG